MVKDAINNPDEEKSKKSSSKKTTEENGKTVRADVNLLASFDSLGSDIRRKI
jgi:hypothetical protein